MFIILGLVSLTNLERGSALSLGVPAHSGQTMGSRSQSQSLTLDSER